MNCIDYWMDFGVYAKDEIEEFAKIFFNLKEKPEKMQPMLDKVVDVWKSKAENERKISDQLFKVSSACMDLCPNLLLL